MIVRSSLSSSFRISRFISYRFPGSELASEVVGSIELCNSTELLFPPFYTVQELNFTVLCVILYFTVRLCKLLDNMHGIKDDREDSDGEEMEHESGESDKSSSSCDSSDAPSDSDDSSGIELLCNCVWK